MRDFADRIAVVTGAGSGIGRALAVGLAQRGCNVAAVDINDDGLAQTARAIEALGRRASTHHIDVADRGAMEALPDAVEGEFGRVDIVVNNAGVSVAGTLDEQTLDDFEWVVRVNLLGVAYGCKVFLPLLRRSDDAYIVNLSSVFGLVGAPRQSSYCATKFAIRGLSESLGAELSDSPIRVMSVHPGAVRTGIAKAARYRGQSVHSRAQMVDMFEHDAMAPERVATLTIDAMGRNRDRLIVTEQAQGLDALKRLLPRIPGRLIRWAERQVAGG